MSSNIRPSPAYHGQERFSDTFVMNLLGKSKEELRALLESLGEPGYRSAQIYHALYAERRTSFAAMSNLPAALRERLAREASMALPRVVRRHLSTDGTVRYVLALDDSSVSGDGRSSKPATIETVFMP
jgi:adenine C2-methylase RlmN of 23S rRNA A2503 and tRNA A37